jgi:multidrug efflux system membrane fusion protein
VKRPNLIALVLSGAALVGGCSRRDAGAGPAAGAGPMLVPVTVAVAEARDMPEVLRAIGSVEPTSTVVLKPRVAAQLLEAKFSEGQEVKAGDVLLLLDARPFEAALHEAEANLAKSRALAADASHWLERLQQAENAGSTAPRETEQARAAADAAQASTLVAEAQVEEAKLNLEYCTIRSPINGRAGTLMVKPGNVVKENETALVEINQISPINVAFAIPETHLDTIRDRQAAAALPVQVAPPNRPERTSDGRLIFIDNRVDVATGTIRLRATFANDDGRLWPGEFVNAALTLGVRKGAVTIPSRALQSSQRGTFVFVVSGGTAEEREVEVGENEGEVLVVTGGLKGGETVVTDGQIRLVPGAKVQVQNSSAQAVAAPTGAGG